jgi:hypothetical protein
MATTDFTSTAQSDPVATTAVFDVTVLSLLCGAGYRENPDAAMSHTHGLGERRVIRAIQ